MTCRRDANICTWQRHGNLFLTMRVQFQYAGCHWQPASNPPNLAPLARQYRDATTDSPGHILIINICLNIFKYIPTRFLRRLLRRLHAIRDVPQNVFGETPRDTGGTVAVWFQVVLALCLHSWDQFRCLPLCCAIVEWRFLVWSRSCFIATIVHTKQLYFA